MPSTSPIAVDPVVLRAAIAGSVHVPGDPGWDEARQAWVLSADQHPELVVTPASVQDVVAIVRFAREAGLRVAVQGTGHNAGPRAAKGLDGALLLRMDGLRGVEVDVAGRTATVGAGTLAGDIQAAASPHGLAPLSGSSPDVSIAGYALGGGMGWLGRRFGLCSDSIVSAQVVLADGRVVRTDAEHEPELFWALRGGGGSFGIVTELTLRLFEVPAVHAGWLLWPWERTREVLHAWRTWCATAPEEATTSLRIMQLPDMPDLPAPLRGAKIVVIDGAVLGDDGFVAEVLAPLRALGPAMDTFASVEPGALIRVHGDPETPMPGHSCSRLLREVDASLLDQIVDVAGPDSGTALMFTELRQLGGALARREGAGALGGFDAELCLFAFGIPVTPEVGEAQIGSFARLMAATAAHDAGQYLNFADAPIDVATAFGEDRYARLQAVRAAVDPDGLLAPNHEV